MFWLFKLHHTVVNFSDFMQWQCICCKCSKWILPLLVNTLIFIDKCKIYMDALRHRKYKQHGYINKCDIFCIIKKQIREINTPGLLATNSLHRDIPAVLHLVKPPSPILLKPVTPDDRYSWLDSFGSSEICIKISTNVSNQWHNEMYINGSKPVLKRGV